MRPEAETWFADHTWQRPPWTIEELTAAKNGRTVSVVLPALNEEATVGQVVTTIIPLTGEPQLVNEVVVVDSGSTDRTRQVAAQAGARVVQRQDVLPDLPVQSGKGEVLWRSLAATTGDLLVFIDSDLVDFDEASCPHCWGHC